MPQRPHICVCVCTYQRPELLRRLLSGLEQQETEGLFDYSIVIVDNDRSESARQTVESYARQSKISISYDVEPEQNIALARNKTVENAEGDFICFIDDDELPDGRWLLQLYKAVICFESDGILGPVLPWFEKEPPGWILKGHFFHRPTHYTGHISEWKNARTGNALLNRSLFKKHELWFNPVFGSGGEDRDFFRRKIEKGHVFVWCNEAPVFETVPPHRWSRTVLLKRALLRGENAINLPGSKRVSVINSAAAIVVYTGCLPLFLVLGHHIFMKYLIREFDHIGKLLAVCGIKVIKEKYVT
jgi:succinoglycan biosynthesis protein ExoM